MKTAYFERFEIDYPDNAVDECNHQGRCDDDVDYWSSRIERSETITTELLKAELKEYGAWDDEELSDDDANWKRIIWIGAGNIKEGDYD